MTFVKNRQVMVLWALLTPLLIIFVDAGMALGWYCLTISRLQNAADAAVLAGIRQQKSLRHCRQKIRLGHLEYRRK